MQYVSLIVQCSNPSGYRMSAKNTRVQVSTFPGCTILDMADHVKPIQRKRPDKLILHVGTNSLKSRETSTKHAEEIISLAESVKNTLPETEVIIYIWSNYSDRQW